MLQNLALSFFPLFLLKWTSFAQYALSYEEYKGRVRTARTSMTTTDAMCIMHLREL
jgi:hypothetical protein